MAISHWLAALLATTSGPQRPVAEALLDSIGVNIHVEYTDGGYRDPGRIIDSLRFIHVSHVRDNAPWPASQGQAGYGVLADAGVRFDLMVNRSNLDAAMALVHEFALRHPGAVDSVEGPNETNNFPVTYQGRSDRPAQVAYQTNLYRAVKADPELARAPVIDLTSWPELSGPADFSNIHPYPKDGGQPGGELASAVAVERIRAPDRPVMITEAGYFSLPHGSGWIGVDEATQATYLINLLLDAYRLGVRRTYIYQLFDAYPDAKQNDQEKHFGLFRLDYSPKPAAWALRRLTETLSGYSAAPERSPPEVDVGTLPASARMLYLHRRDGWGVLALWNEEPIWDAKAMALVAVEPHPVEVRLSRKVRQVNQVDVFDDPKNRETWADVSAFNIGLGARPVLVLISPK